MKTRRREALGWNRFIIIILLLVWRRVCYGQNIRDSIEPGFRASPISRADDDGILLRSSNGTFWLQLYSPAKDQKYYACIVHNRTGAVVWSANRDVPMAESGEFRVTETGAAIQNSVGEILWSPKQNGSMDVINMQLMDNGNLVMLGAGNEVLWESFRYPTDTLLPGQRLVQGSNLVSNAAETDFSTGDYSVSLTERDLVLVWSSGEPQTYWSMAGAKGVVRYGSDLTDLWYAAMTESGFSLFSKFNGLSMVWQTNNSDGALTRAVIRSNGQFEILTLVDRRWASTLLAVKNACSLPKACGPLGVCSRLTPKRGFQCSCPASLRFVNQTNPSEGCTTRCKTQSCNSNYKDLLAKSSVQFLSMGRGVEYFAPQFQKPIRSSISLRDCRQLCLTKCSCAGFSFKKNSGSCFVHETLGTLGINGTQDSVFLKVTSTENPALPIVLGSVGAVFLAALLISIGWLWWCRKRGRQFLSRLPQSSDVEDEHVLRTFRGLPTRFSYKDLQTATENFAHQIGSGAYAIVYEGTLPDATKVAVKKLRCTTDAKLRHEFIMEIATIGSIHHANLVKLLGFCVEGPHRVLVYEFMNRGSLDRSLFGSVGLPVLAWEERYAIALGTAKALAYLHEDCNEKIIHCDIKPENILLNDESQTKVSDFGLAKLMSREQSQAVVSNMRGTRGYMAPEWLTHAPISHKIDVYSYGMVLLEIVAGRKNFSPPDSCSNTDPISDLSFSLNYFPAYALQLCQMGGPFTVLADPRLEGRFPPEEVTRLVRIALCCLHEDSIKRPSMSKVVQMLEGNERVDEPQVESLLFLRVYARRVNSHVPASAASSFVGSPKVSASTTGSSSCNSPTQMSMTSAAHLSEAR